MNDFLAGYWRLLRAIGTVERVVGVLLIANIVVNIGAQVFSRYVLDQPLVWVEELAVYSPEQEVRIATRQQARGGWLHRMFSDRGLVSSQDESVADRQIEAVRELRRTRSDSAVRSALDRLKRGAEGHENTMRLLIDAARAYATVGEMCGALRDVWGEWEETAAI